MLSQEEVELREIERERATRCAARCFYIYITILSLTTGSLQAATERGIEVPEFDQDEKDTILARACSLALSSSLRAFHNVIQFTRLFHEI